MSIHKIDELPIKHSRYKMLIIKNVLQELQKNGDALHSAHLKVAQCYWELKGPLAKGVRRSVPT